jgi:hypothetical protein
LCFELIQYMEVYDVKTNRHSSQAKYFGHNMDKSRMSMAETQNTYTYVI